MKQDPLLKYLALTIFIGVVIAIVDPTKTADQNQARAEVPVQVAASR